MIGGATLSQAAIQVLLWSINGHSENHLETNGTWLSMNWREEKQLLIHREKQLLISLHSSCLI